MSHRSNPVPVILVLAAGLAATAFGACSVETADAPTTQTAALSANEPAKSDRPFKVHGPDALFARWDPDGDGKVALADLPEKMRNHLSRADVDHDGFLTRDELRQAHQAMRAERFARADKNHDGALSADEVPAERWEHLQVADANHDGKVTAAELDAAMATGKLKPPPGHRGEHRMGPQQ